MALRTDIAALNLPRASSCAPSRTSSPSRARARLPLIKQPGPRFGLYLAKHREALPAVRAFLSLKPPASYARLRYNALPRTDGSTRTVPSATCATAGCPPKPARLRSPAPRRRRPARTTSMRRSSSASVARARALPPPGSSSPTRAIRPQTRPRWARPARDGGRWHAGATELETGRDTGGDILVFDPHPGDRRHRALGRPDPSFRSEAYSVSVKSEPALRPAGLDALGAAAVGQLQVVLPLARGLESWKTPSKVSGAIVAS